MIVMIEAGCAECRIYDDSPLVAIHQFRTVEEAKAWAQEEKWLTGTGFNGEPLTLTWEEHPQGGQHVVAGQGSVWITPLSTDTEIEDYEL